MTEPVRIAFCITDLDPGGAERALVQLVTRLDRARWSPTVYCLSGSGALVERLVEAGVPVTCLGAQNRFSLSVVPRLARQLKKSRPELLQTYLFHANLVGRIAGRLAGVPRIVSGIRVAERRSRVRLWADRATQRLVDHHVCVSRAVADFSIQKGGLSREQMSVIPNGVDLQRFAKAEAGDLSEFGIPVGSRSVLCVGRLDAQKNPLGLLSAMREMFRDESNLHLLFVGEGSLRDELETTIQKQDLTARVHLAGWRSDVAELMKGSTCLALPSRWEGMPNVVLEAMAAGLPVVATRVEGTEELIRDGETGLLVSPTSPPELAAALGRLLSDPVKASEMARMAQGVVEKEFPWSAVVARYEELYRKLLSQ